MFSAPQPPILFYATNAPYDIFSNVAPGAFELKLNAKNGANINCQGMSCCELAYQGIKALTSTSDPAAPAIATKLLMGGPPGAWIQATGNPIQNKLFMGNATAQPNTLKERLMHDLLLCKVTQNPAILKALLETGNTPLIENTALANYVDDFWGNGKSGQGRNALGNIWMQIRTELLNELSQTNNIAIRTGLSQQTCHDLGLGYNSLSEKNNHYLDSTTIAQTNSISLSAQLPRYSATPVPAPQFYAASSSSSSTSTMQQIQQADATINRLRTATGDTGLTVSINNVSGQDCIQLHFLDPKAAENFAKKFGKVYSYKNNISEPVPLNFSIGIQQEEFVFKNLNIPTHGRTHPTSFGKALKYDLQKAAHSQPSAAASSAAAPALPSTPTFTTPMSPASSSSSSSSLSTGNMIHQLHQYPTALKNTHTPAPAVQPSATSSSSSSAAAGNSSNVEKIGIETNNHQHFIRIRFKPGGFAQVFVEKATPILHVAPASSSQDVFLTPAQAKQLQNYMETSGVAPKTQTDTLIAAVELATAPPPNKMRRP
jgi:predicted NAD-dependent protein-ADP-ribosyltransferase YbiA (DUF1768 family)